ncbi:MAG TPA: VOC family protein [Vicinamibacterales bacterium]|jgi:uncharacterized glyoxalase superfamily protein PhnB
MAIRRRETGKKKAAKRSPRKTVRPAARPSKRPQRKTEPETLRLRSIEPSLTVADLQRSIKFYSEALGFFISDRHTDKSGTLLGVMLKAGVCEIGLSQDDWAKGRDRQRGGAMRIYCTTVQDIDKLAARVKAAGYQLTDDARDQAWGGRAFSVDDPDGFHLTIYRPTE